jgi:hypothetical protein
VPLKLCPTGLGSGIDKDRPDYTVYCGDWAIGRIYETRGGPENLRWFWSLTVNPPMARSNKAATLEEPRRSFSGAGPPGRRGRSWKRWGKPTVFGATLSGPRIMRWDQHVSPAIALRTDVNPKPIRATDGRNDRH